ncbi:uncharacterized protein PV06_08514 [Exophiala oligosperma]|uniref:RING-CH-type domain-containing protein n=2 Tax=Chaetothyriales TaxID=34395 RepID=A0A0D2BR60_9EURO|nr:uncharacterized protein PV06_08514 [Exophiala oligosperma]KAJ9634031.1 hypothetical protein H2204_006579 [Knufia peltigerae]KIW39952.1 hypothetical protein PV06_08514 [Exophiala oligosperma]
MESTKEPTVDGAQDSSTRPSQTWTYPPRTCRLCLEDVYPVVTLYPPGVPARLQRPIVEYKNDDEYGRLIKPCHCRGGMRYIHELCLRRSRVEVRRSDSLWKCHQCGYRFNFKRLTVQKYLESKIVSGVLTVSVMLVAMFLLGFVADPILNFYADPYETILGEEELWQEVAVNDFDETMSGWLLHFTKGFVSMGVMSFLRTMILNPFQWWSLRHNGFVSTRVAGRATTGRDRAMNVSWIVIVMGIVSATWLFYQGVQTIIRRSLQHIGNNIVDTHLSGDDDDLKPPPDWRYQPPANESQDSPFEEKGADGPLEDEVSHHDEIPNSDYPRRDSGALLSTQAKVQSSSDSARTVNSMPGAFNTGSAYSSALEGMQEQAWSFRGI